MRKWFHLLALAVYVPGIVLDPLLLKVSSALVTVAFIVIEVKPERQTDRERQRDRDSERQNNDINNFSLSLFLY